MVKCDVIRCENEVYTDGSMCSECDRKFNSERYYIHCCSRCGSIVFFSKRISKHFDRVRTLTCCPKCVRYHSVKDEFGEEEE